MKASTGTRRPKRRPRAAKHVAERDVREAPNDMIAAAGCCVLRMDLQSICECRCRTRVCVL
ncbi:unnamed protein product [Ectocarpus sp. CCAP 1310/34]|nr:unnamed protein product [Ectocarpus sp. CCAP 1310/34]